MSDAIVLRNVRKTFGEKIAVEGMDLRIAAGSLTGFIGPNGAGKTTTIRMIMSILFPDSGEVEVLGRKSAVESKDRIGYLPEERGVYKKMKVGAFLEHMARLKGCHGPAVRQNVRDWLAKVQLEGVEKKKCEELSKGMQQKVQFISSVIHGPDLVILDEPFSGLDPVNMRLLRDLILEQHKAGRTVIFSTHAMHTAEQLCDQIVMIHEGQKVLDASLDEIVRKRHANTIVFEPEDPEGDVAAVARVAGVESVVRSKRQLWVARLREGTPVSQAMAGILSVMPMAMIGIGRPSLEDIFVEIVAGSGNTERAEAVREQLALAQAGSGGDEA